LRGQVREVAALQCSGREREGLKSMTFAGGSIGPSIGTAMQLLARPQDGADLRSTELLLIDGDERITLDPRTGLNTYGCAPVPDPTVTAFGSSTASTISEAAFSAADDLRRRLADAADREPSSITYGRELERIRNELTHLCGLADLPGLEIAFAASGTDLHLLTAQLASDRRAGLFVIMAEPADTGSGVAAALAGRHFVKSTALGHLVREGTAIAGSGPIEIASVAGRNTDGLLRSPAAIAADVETLVRKAVGAGLNVLLMVTDVSKTGVMMPDPACALELRRRFPGSVEVMVDACQFRLASPTLRAYLEHGFLVALTGSKFFTGPSFCGALLIPQSVAQWLQVCRLAPDLAAYSTRADWPSGFAARSSLKDVANCGLLLRWEAALEELRAFRAVPAETVATFFSAFAQAVQGRLAADSIFEPLPVPALDRQAIGADASWDHIPTIFAFLLRHVGGAERPFNREDTARVHRLMTQACAAELGIEPGTPAWKVLADRYQLGQPVLCGRRGSEPLSALRLCASSRLVLDAVSEGADVVIGRAMAALDKAALIAHIISSARQEFAGRASA
jgi:hypothetical protein